MSLRLCFRIITPFLKPAHPSGDGAAFFSTTALTAVKQMPPRPTVAESEIEESFLKGTGPGGQKIVRRLPTLPTVSLHYSPHSSLLLVDENEQNKTSSAVQLRHIPTGMVVKSQATRSRTQNRKIARQLLAEKLEVLEKGDQSRVMVKGEVKRKRKASKAKKARRKYRRLAGEKGEGDMDEDGEVEGEGEGEEVEDDGEGETEGDIRGGVEKKERSGSGTA
jgi:protein subunit release factor B